MCLPMLKTLVLDSVRFGRGPFQTLLPDFPALEELMLLNIWWRDRNVVLSSSTLKKLKITSKGGCLGTFSIDTHTPNPVFFDYADSVADDYPLVNLTNLVEAGINLALTEDRTRRARANVVKLINGIQNVNILHVSPVSFKVRFLFQFLL
ncbi:unnamed protein product [Thlaspi arvense]|uniref:Uncharacterized protein n=1 Tax=Thlaspi arvense TaxID=13288 RepID=A0AAU9RVL8_THLAR|nr:unnamed protein product [Thlaspi arvense]